jgi:hypothetical protein
MKNTVKITKAQLISMLLNWNFGAQPANVQYMTSPALNKEGKQLFGMVSKIAAVGCMIGYDFEKSVNNQLAREGKVADFKVKPLWKGKGIHKNAQLVEHEDSKELYLSYKYQQTFKAFHFDAALNFIPKAMLKPFLTGSKPTNQGVAEGSEVLPRTLKIENIRKIKMKKITYVIEG